MPQHFLDRISLRIKHILSRHISEANLKRSSLLISLVSCLSDGSLALFPLFLTSLHEVVGFTDPQIELIEKLPNLMYLLLPFVTYLPAFFELPLLSLYPIWFFCPCYFINSILISKLQDRPEGPLNEYYVYAFGVSFGLIRLALASVLSLSLSTCVKIYPDRKGLAWFPVISYGISFLIYPQWIKLPYFKHCNTPKESYLNLYRVFVVFGFLHLFMGILNFISNSVVIEEQEVILNPNCTEKDTPVLDKLWKWTVNFLHWVDPLIITICIHEILWIRYVMWNSRK